MAFPVPEQLASASEKQLRELGWSRQKARAALELTYPLAKEPDALTRFEIMSNEDIYQALLPLRGIGRWTAK